MSKGTEKQLLLKRTLFRTKDVIVERLTNPKYSNELTVNERLIYQRWLGNINSLIGICEERNKF